jgi:hypothetical protein
VWLFVLSLLPHSCQLPLEQGVRNTLFHYTYVRTLDAHAAGASRRLNAAVARCGASFGPLEAATSCSTCTGATAHRSSHPNPVQHARLAPAVCTSRRRPSALLPTLHSPAYASLLPTPSSAPPHHFFAFFLLFFFLLLAPAPAPVLLPPADGCVRALQAGGRRVQHTVQASGAPKQHPEGSLPQLVRDAHLLLLAAAAARTSRARERSCPCCRHAATATAAAADTAAAAATSAPRAATWPPACCCLLLPCRRCFAGRHELLLWPRLGSRCGLFGRPRGEELEQLGDAWCSSTKCSATRHTHMSAVLLRQQAAHNTQLAPSSHLAGSAAAA